MARLFTDEELEELRRADEEIEKAFSLSQEDIDRSRKLDREAKLDRLDNRGKKIAAQRAAYREANREKLAAQQAAYREANREKLAAQQAAYYEANREKIAAYQAAYYKANREKIAAHVVPVQGRKMEGGCASWQGPKGTEGVVSPEYEFKIDFGSSEDQAEIVAAIQESMRQELGKTWVDEPGNREKIAAQKAN